MKTDAQRNVEQLKALLREQEFTATRIGEPGCRVRRLAEDHVSALRWAIGRLEGREEGAQEGIGLQPL